MNDAVPSFNRSYEPDSQKENFIASNELSGQGPAFTISNESRRLTKQVINTIYYSSHQDDINAR